MDKAKETHREQLILKLQKKFGEKTIFKMSENLTQVKTLPTGCLSLDLASGVGGFPKGRIVEIFGPEGAGKSMLLLSAIAQTQANGGSCAFVDMEHALTPSFAELIGVDTDNLYLAKPDTGNDALQIMEDLIASGLFDIVGLDSVASLTTEAELDSDYNQQHIAPLAKLMANSLKCMTARISKTQTVAVFINQIREKPMTMFGKSEYTTGGKSLKFYASMRIEVRKKSSKVKDTGGHTVRCTFEKNKLAPPYSQCEVRLDYKYGLDRVYDIMLMAKQLDIIEQKGSWFNYKDMKWAGLEAVQEKLVQDGGLLEELHKEIRKRIGLR